MISFGEFKGNKMIILKKSEDDPYPFQFGKTKAKLIVEYFEDIKKFAEDQEQQTPKVETQEKMSSEETVY